MPCQFVLIFSHLTHLTGIDQRNISQALHVVIIRLILQAFGFLYVCAAVFLLVFFFFFRGPFAAPFVEQLLL